MFRPLEVENGSLITNKLSAAGTVYGDRPSQTAVESRDCLQGLLLIDSETEQKMKKAFWWPEAPLYCKGRRLGVCERGEWRRVGGRGGR